MRIVAIAAGSDASGAEKAARSLGVRFAAMGDPAAARELACRLRDTDVRVFSGPRGICEMIACAPADGVLNAMRGEAGLRPTLAALESGKALALANKESLVCGGEIVRKTLRRTGGTLLPVDSEHSAIFQCLTCGSREEVESITLTASGGPFFGMTREQMRDFTAADALRHPTWQMGAKITVDSASMCNKGFEVIEAMHLFDLPPDRIRVVVHRESIVHSYVNFVDGVTIAQLGAPDMRTPIAHALTYPARSPGLSPPLDLSRVGKLTFAVPDEEAFPLLPLARRAAEAGGVAPAALNAASEVADDAFLAGKISFGRMTDAILAVGERFLSQKPSGALTLDKIEDASREARRLCAEQVARFA